MKSMTFAVLLIIAAASKSFGQTCLHDPSEQANQRLRREQALQLAQRINLAQAIIIGPRTNQPRYRPLDQLANLPPTPAGFVLHFHTDGTTYMFSLKDSLDPCDYAVFSDQDKRIYEATPRTGASVVPVTQ
jgi:hypothetical protein